MPNINENRGGARKNAGRKKGITIKSDDEKSIKKTYSLTRQNVITLKILGGSKYLNSLLNYFYLKSNTKVFCIPVCVFYQILNPICGLFEVTDKSYYEQANSNNKYDLTTLQEVYNNNKNEIILKLKDNTEIIL